MDYKNINEDDMSRIDLNQCLVTSRAVISSVKQQEPGRHDNTAASFFP
jgi:hypothetical protein